jgi:predicted TIM-barrel fold metal-dependent hydrolase
MTSTQDYVEATKASSTRVVILSMDSHVAPPVEHYRPYCPKKYLDAFDDFSTAFAEELRVSPGAGSPFYKVGPEQSERTGAYWHEINTRYNDVDHYADVATRLKSMDDDGIAGELIFHGGHNRFPQPFSSPELGEMYSKFIPPSARAAELRVAGIQIYNDWLAAWIEAAPTRLFGVAYVPIWDVDKAVAEVKRAHQLGFHAVNLPAPKVGLRTYNVSDYYPFWEACQETGMTLQSHVSTGDPQDPDPGPGAYSMHMAEQEYASRRHLWHLIFGGVFERFPGLKIAFTEQCGTWAVPTLETLDSVYFASQQARDSPFIRDILPRRPSDYFKSNVYIGASFTARFEIQAAIEAGYAHKLMWGRDYPHPEGTWPCTKESIRYGFAGFPDDTIRAILGETAASFLDVDLGSLSPIAERVGPSIEAIQTPLEQIPAEANLSSGFRNIGPYA